MAPRLTLLLALSLLQYTPGLKIRVPVLRVSIPCVRDLDCGDGGRCVVSGVGLCGKPSGEQEQARSSSSQLSETNITSPHAFNTSFNTISNITDLPPRQLRHLQAPPAPCLWDEQCASGHCVKVGVGVCTVDHRCDVCGPKQWCDGKKCLSKRTYNSSCDREEQCESSVCRGGLCGCEEDEECSSEEFCSSDGTCEERKSYASSCENNEQCKSLLCIDGSSGKQCGCDDSDCSSAEICSSRGTCEAKKSYQSSCESDEECKSLLCVVGASGKRCACGDDSDCSSGERCLSDGSCIVPKSDRSRCAADEECISNDCWVLSGKCRCTDDSCPSDEYCKPLLGVCGAKLSSGVKCIYDGQCRSGNCRCIRPRCSCD
ncbi:integrin beta-like protein 1 [Amphibalanus amphitrite]|uniref:integrin beta-like protein 1 n=1 Tax=Amphibalanus amphitrite TaxID=1232801 RepID=UPI001C92B1B1|nr:integrin beta-like protein 1 [Amphibalanus amphitrite]